MSQSAVAAAACLISLKTGATCPVDRATFLCRSCRKVSDFIPVAQTFGSLCLFKFGVASFFFWGSFFAVCGHDKPKGCAWKVESTNHLFQIRSLSSLVSLVLAFFLHLFAPSFLFYRTELLLSHSSIHSFFISVLVTFTIKLSSLSQKPSLYYLQHFITPCVKPKWYPRKSSSSTGLNRIKHTHTHISHSFAIVSSLYW